MEIIRANEEQIDALAKEFPSAAPILCRGENGYTLILYDYYNVITAFASVMRRSIPAPVGGCTEEFINVIDVVREDCRKKGLGSRLVRAVIAMAAEAGSIQVRAYCDIGNAASHALWLKNGFGISPVKQGDGTICGSYCTYRISEFDLLRKTKTT